MIAIPDQLYTSLKEIYIFANIPEYIVSRYLQLYELESVAHQYNAIEITGSISSIIRRESWSLNDIVAMYAFICALYYKDYAEVHTYLTMLQSVHIEWVSHLAYIVQKNMSVGNDVNHNETYKLIGNDYTLIVDATNSQAEHARNSQLLITKE